MKALVLSIGRDCSPFPRGANQGNRVAARRVHSVQPEELRIA